MNAWREFYNSCIHMFFPAMCFHCQAVLPPSHPHLCPLCASLLEPIDPKGRCTRCFNLRLNISHRCKGCRSSPSLFLRQASVFDYQGPASSLIKQFKYGNKPYLSKGLGAYLCLQLEALKWPIPDVLVPVPLSLYHHLQRGYNQSSLLAEELGRLLGIPVLHALKRTSNDFSQVALSLDQRRALGYVFKLKKKSAVQDKRVMVIDDVRTTGATLDKCAAALCAGYPASIYALTVCTTLNE
ncbi:MAG: ComF family protein [Candidatus Protochlamydia sp.]|nr:ComF family protein [Candidatus Protochlamydia sp.]